MKDVLDLFLQLVALLYQSVNLSVLRLCFTVSDTSAMKTHKSNPTAQFSVLLQSVVVYYTNLKYY